MRKVAIITSRQQSQRLPNKALIPIGEKPLIKFLYDRVIQSKVDETVIATTESSKEILKLCIQNMMPFSVGDEEDQLSRIYDTAVKFEADVIVRIWGDSPLLAPSIINNLLDIRRQYNFDYAQTIKYPMGMRVVCLKMSALKYAQENISKAQRAIFNEVDEPAYWMNNARFRTGALVSPVNLSKLKLDVDTQEDLDNVRFIYENLIRCA